MLTAAPLREAVCMVNTDQYTMYHICTNNTSITE